MGSTGITLSLRRPRDRRWFARFIETMKARHKTLVTGWTLNKALQTAACPVLVDGNVTKTVLSHLDHQWYCHAPKGERTVCSRKSKPSAEVSFKNPKTTVLEFLKGFRCRDPRPVDGWRRQLGSDVFS